jgi:Zn-finger nucleic acid-binding protein
MSGDSWDGMRKAKEEAYFEKVNREALERLQKRPKGAERLSPVTGKPMDQITIMGVVVDHCPDTGGIWLDNGELEQILKGYSKMEKDEREGWLYSLLENVSNLFDSKEKKK